MKKIKKTFIASILITCAIIIIGMPSQKVQASRLVFPITDPQANKDGLGYSINAAKSKYIDLTEIKDGAPIFDNKWRSTMVCLAIKQEVNSSSTYSVSGNSFENIKSSYGETLDFNDSVAFGYDVFTANLKNGYSLGLNIDYTKYQSQYYYKFNSEFVDYTYALPNYSSNLNEYINNLHPDYVSNLKRVIAGTMDADEFFDKYGTHVIAKGKYGGKVELYYTAASNYYDVGLSLYNKINYALKINVEDQLGASSNISFDLGTQLDLNRNNFEDKFTINCYGGNRLSPISLNDFANKYDSWYESIDGNQTLIGTTSDGLIPLWDLLPSGYNEIQKLKFKSKLLTYLMKNSVSNSLFAPEDLGASFSFDALGEYGERKITDEGRFIHNVHDTVDLLEQGKINLNILKENGYKYISVKVDAQMKEIDHGYQYIMLYNSESKDANALESIKFELNGDKKQTTYTRHSETFWNIPIDVFITNPYVVIRYGASGSFEDDWLIKQVVITITYSKDTLNS